MTDRLPRMLYLLEREDGAFKVGSSTHPARRMRDLEKEQGYDFVLLREWKHPNALGVEMRIHVALRRRPDVQFTHYGGMETYEATKTVILKVIQEQLSAWAHRHPQEAV